MTKYPVLCLWIDGEMVFAFQGPQCNYGCSIMRPENPVYEIIIYVWWLNIIPKCLPSWGCRVSRQKDTVLGSQKRYLEVGQRSVGRQYEEGVPWTYASATQRESQMPPESNPGERRATPMSSHPLWGHATGAPHTPEGRTITLVLRASKWCPHPSKLTEQKVIQGNNRDLLNGVQKQFNV